MFSGLHNLHKLLKENATNVPTELANGNYGLLLMIIIPIHLETLYGHEWIPPNDPGAPLILVTVTSTVNMNKIIHSHQNKVNQYNLMINTESALKQQIMSSVDIDYLMGLRADDTEFADVLAWTIMDYLYTNYGNIEEKYAFTNKHRLTDNFYPAQLIFNIFNRYKDISTISTKGRQPISAQDKCYQNMYYIKHQLHKIKRSKTGII